MSSNQLLGKGSNVNISMEAVCVKEELEWDGVVAKDEPGAGARGMSEEVTQAGLYVDHIVKDELVLGPELLQPHDTVSALRGEQHLLLEKGSNGNISMEAARVKVEPKWEPVVVKDEPEWEPGAGACGVSGAVTQAGLYVGHVVKDELVLELQPPDAVFAQQASLPTEDSHLSSLKIKEPGRTCSVILERMPLDLEQWTYRIGDRLNHFQWYLQTQGTDFKRDVNSCNRTFDMKLLQLQHATRQHGVKYFTCTECQYATKHAHVLKCHLRTHTGEKPFKCNQCSSEFKQKSNLLSHQRIHTGEKPFKCNQCSSKFNQKSHLLQHQRTHTGEKPFKCNQCISKFNRKSDLLIHQRTHTGEKPFKCSQCTSAFNRKQYLLMHQRIHTGERPFECNQCSSRFNRKSILRVHQKTHTGESLSSAISESQPFQI